jgi:hypothetical protein
MVSPGFDDETGYFFIAAPVIVREGVRSKGETLKGFPTNYCKMKIALFIEMLYNT